MEKLLNLLQEFYGENRKFSNENGFLTMTNGVENLSGAYAQTYIISLKGGFIKWLVENDKIDNKKIADETYVKVNGEWYELILGCHYDLYQQTLMLLAIQDEPIRFLCEIIK